MELVRVVRACVPVVAIKGDSPLVNPSKMSGGEEGRGPRGTTMKEGVWEGGEEEAQEGGGGGFLVSSGLMGMLGGNCRYGDG